VLVFEHEDDARRVLAVLHKCMERYGLRLHPEKTRLVNFRSPGRRRPRVGDGTWRPGTFDLLGFTHFWDRTRRCTWVVRRKTSRKRLSAALRRVRQWCRWNRHLPIEQQQQMLSRKVLGHYGYYGITGNLRALQRFFFEVRCGWRFWLDRSRVDVPRGRPQPLQPTRGGLGLRRSYTWS
jgi:RNA-directed DNA polymerase